MMKEKERKKEKNEFISSDLTDSITVLLSGMEHCSCTDEVPSLVSERVRTSELEKTLRIST